jgi:hypothetical protein
VRLSPFREWLLPVDEIKEWHLSFDVAAAHPEGRENREGGENQEEWVVGQGCMQDRV